MMLLSFVHVSCSFVRFKSIFEAPFVVPMLSGLCVGLFHAVFSCLSLCLDAAVALDHTSVLWSGGYPQLGYKVIYFMVP